MNGGGASPFPTAQLLITPADGTTASEGADIVFSLYDPVGIVTDAWLEQLKVKAFLQTWPERTPVAFQAEALPEPPASYKVVHLLPAAPLDGRWYVAGVGNGLPPADPLLHAVDRRDERCAIPSRLAPARA
jgi:hypothetical protein